MNTIVVALIVIVIFALILLNANKLNVESEEHFWPYGEAVWNNPTRYYNYYYPFYYPYYYYNPYSYYYSYYPMNYNPYYYPYYTYFF